MPSTVRLPREPSPLDVIVVGVDVIAQHDAASEASPRDEQRPALEINLAGEGVPARPVSPDEDIAAIFGEENPPPDKKRSRQRLSADVKVDAAHNALEGLRALQKLMLLTD